jgi:membrane-associated phospholipid phosphatase
LQHRRYNTDALPLPGQLHHPMPSLFFLTCFTKLADTNVMMPLAFLLAAWLACLQRWREAALWLLLFCAALGIVAATKIAYVGWGIGIASLDFAGISGHAMRAAAVAPVFAYLALRKRTSAATTIAWVAGVAFGIMIAISRLVLHQHSVSEVVSGVLLGNATAFAFLSLRQTHRMLPWNIAVVAVCLLIVIAGLMAKPAPTERLIVRISLYLSGRDTPYHRARTAPPWMEKKQGVD